jgi:hypothetical protein
MSATVARMPTQRHGGGNDDRYQLRAAIQSRQHAQAAVEKHKDAIAKARHLVTRADRAAEKAAAGVIQAKDEQARLMVESIRAGDDEVAGGTAILRAARAQEVAGLDEAESARGALKRLQEASAGIEAALIEAEVGVTVAIHALLAPAVRDALERLKQLDAERAPLMALLRFAQEELGLECAPRARDATFELRLQRALDGPLESVRAEINQHFAALRSEGTRRAP